MTDTDWFAARELAHNAGRSVPAFVEKVPLNNAVGRTLALDLFALDQIPGYASSAMDGWVVAGTGPWRVGAPIATGADIPDRLAPGDARPIGTGGPIPPGAFAVVRREIGQLVGNAPQGNALPAGPSDPAILDAVVKAGADIRRAGEEADIGDVLIYEGTLLTPPRVAVAASAGHDELAVRVRPVVDIVVLGNEVESSGIPRPGRVRDVFGAALPGAIARAGGVHGATKYVGDIRTATAEAIRTSTADIVILTGGTSRGAADHARDALNDVRATFLFDGVGMRPGHPTILARGLNDALILCLPGNPLAGILAFASFAPAIVAGMHGAPLPEFGAIKSALALPNSREGIQFIACSVDANTARPVNYQDSGMSRGLAMADCVAIVPPGGVAAGSLVQTLPLPW